MTEHLPECPNHCINVPADYLERDVYMRRCICSKLRACKKRVMDAAVQRVIELPDLLDAGFTYSGLLRRGAVIEALKKNP